MSVRDELEKAIETASQRNQLRMVEQLTFQLAKYDADTSEWQSGWSQLQALWKRLYCRREEWWDLLFEWNVLQRRCAIELEALESVVITSWELQSEVFGGKDDFLLKEASGDSENPTPKIVLRAGEVLPIVECEAYFNKKEVHGGDDLQVILLFRGASHPGASGNSLSAVSIEFTEDHPPIKLSHCTTMSKWEKPRLGWERRDISLEKVSHEDPKTGRRFITSLSGQADLNVFSDVSKALQLPLIIKRPGEPRIENVRLQFQYHGYELEMIVPQIFVHHEAARSRLVHCSPFVHHPLSNRLLVHPKVAKVEITLPELHDQYYTGEHISLLTEVKSKELESAEICIDVVCVAYPGRQPPLVACRPQSKQKAESESEQLRPSSQEVRSSAIEVAGGGVGVFIVEFQANDEPGDYNFDIRANYHLVDEPELPLQQAIKLDLPVMQPFEASFDLLPTVHPSIWPSYFATPDAKPDKMQGIQQEWQLQSRVRSVAEEPLVVLGLQLHEQAISRNIKTVLPPIVKLNIPINPSPKQQSYHNESFVIGMAKKSLDDRRSGLADLDLQVDWARPSDTQLVYSTKLSVPQFSVLGSQPRVLASIIRATLSSSNFTVRYMFENPSNYLLRFHLILEQHADYTSEFVGDEVQVGGVLGILPLTRRETKIKVEARIRNGWIRPNIKVVDREFGKVLRVGLTAGCRVDEKGNLRVWVGPQGEPQGLL